MKKLILFFIIVFASNGVFAQKDSYPQKGFHIGLSGDLNTVWIVNQNSYGGDEYQYRLKIGGGGGLDIGYNFNNHIGIQTGVTLSSEGQKYEDSHHNTGLKRDYSLSYTCVPLLFKYIGGNSNVKFFAQAGPRFCFLNSASIKFSSPALTTPAVTNAKTRFTGTDIGAVFGLGANIAVTKSIYISAGMNFFYSFGDINSGKVTSEPGTYKDGTWRWPDQHGAGLYSPSHNGTGGINIGIHYLVGT